MDSNSGLPEAGPETAPVGAEEQFLVPAAPVEIPPAAATEPINPHAENPPWTAIDLFIAAVVFIAVVFAASVVFLFIAAHGFGASAAELAKNPSAEIIVPA